SNGHPTVINEESQLVEPQAVDVIHDKIDEWLGKTKAVLTTGSLSRGLPDDFYATIIRTANGRGVLTAVDAAGVVLRRALEAGPALLKANVEECASVFGSLPEDPWEIAKRMDMDKAAPPQTIVTFGERGALLTSDGDAWRVTPPRISKVNPIGAGD